MKTTKIIIKQPNNATQSALPQGTCYAKEANKGGTEAYLSKETKYLIKITAYLHCTDWNG